MKGYIWSLYVQYVYFVDILTVCYTFIHFL